MEAGEQPFIYGVVLQWGHGREAMDGIPAADIVRRAARLQWGHGREAMDGCVEDRITGAGVVLQWGHGREAMDGRPPAYSPALPPCFNGAMAVRPWMADGLDQHHRRCVASMGPWP